MSLLLDTNVFLEVILGQECADEAAQLLRSADQMDCCATNFSLHSIGLLLFRLGRHADFWDFWRDMVLSGAVGVYGVVGENMASVLSAAKTFGLDFDDAYQYAVAEERHLTIVSFDTDFDATERGRKTPAQVLAEWRGD